MTSSASPTPEESVINEGSSPSKGESANQSTRRTSPIPPETTRDSFLDAGREPNEPDWPTQATTTVVNLVAIARDKTTGSVLNIARALVFGLLAAILALTVGILLLIVTIRLLAEITGRVWLVYLILGFIFTIAGLIVFRKRLPPAQPDLFD